MYGPSLPSTSRLRSRMLRERAAHHHLVVAAPGAVRVELERRDAVLLEPLAGGRPRRRSSRPGEMWSVVTESPRTASTRAPTMSRDGRRLERRDRRRTAASRCRSRPRPRRSGRPSGSAARASARRPRTRPRRSRGTARDRPPSPITARDLVGRRPDVGEEHRLAVRAGAERLGRQVDVDAPGERERDDERRRREVARARQRVDAALEVAVARQDRRRRPGRSPRSPAAIGSSSGPQLPMQVVQP